MNPVWDVLRDGPFEGTYEEMLIASAQLCRRSEILNGTNNNEANGVLMSMSVSGHGEQQVQPQREEESNHHGRNANGHQSRSMEDDANHR